jgi:hypothetical protein
MLYKDVGATKIRKQQQNNDLNASPGPHKNLVCDDIWGQFRSIFLQTSY